MMLKYINFKFCRQICGLLNSNDIYRTLSTFLLEEENLKFTSVMVGTLNTILLTSPELYDLRTQLRDVEKQVTIYWTIISLL